MTTRQAVVDLPGGSAPAWPPDGLIAAVVQDATDGRVLMVGWMDQEAYDATRSTGEVHFHSRSRGRLWRKGETSGNVLRVRRLSLDCDSDAILVEADPAGPTCHRGTRSCFDPGGATATVPAPTGASDDGEGEGQGLAWLEVLWSTITSRAIERPAGSYTTSLLEGGVAATSAKVVEEAAEVVEAAALDAAAQADTASRAGTRADLAGEAADLLYHAMVLLAERDLPPSAVIDVLRSRHAG